MNRLPHVCKAFFIHLLVCANLLFGLLLFKDFLSHEKQGNLNYRPAWYPSSESVMAMSEAAHARDQILQEKEGGALSQIIRSSLSKWGARGRTSNTIMASEEEGSLCDFKKDEGLPKQVLLQKLVECYKEITTSSAKKADELEHANHRMGHYETTHYSNRRLLREVTQKSKEDGVVKKFSKAAPFHLDYSGPQTHPPKNN